MVEMRAKLMEELCLADKIALEVVVSKPAASKEEAAKVLITDMAELRDRDTNVMIWPARGIVY